jgi:hypothetical protein
VVRVTALLYSQVKGIARALSRKFYNMSRILSSSNSREASMGRPYKYNGVEIAQAVEEYIAEREAKGLHPFTVGLAVKLGVDKAMLSRWADYDGDDPDRQLVKSSLKKLKLISELGLADKTLDGKPVGAIFQLKCNHDYVDKQVIDLKASGDLTVVTGVPALGSTKSYDEYMVQGTEYKGQEPSS